MRGLRCQGLNENHCAAAALCTFRSAPRSCFFKEGLCASRCSTSPWDSALGVAPASGTAKSSGINISQAHDIASNWSNCFPNGYWHYQQSVKMPHVPSLPHQLTPTVCPEDTKPEYILRASHSQGANPGFAFCLVFTLNLGKYGRQIIGPDFTLHLLNCWWGATFFHMFVILFEWCFHPTSLLVP